MSLGTSVSNSDVPERHGVYEMGKPLVLNELIEVKAFS